MTGYFHSESGARECDTGRLTLERQLEIAVEALQDVANPPLTGDTHEDLQANMKVARAALELLASRG